MKIHELERRQTQPEKLEIILHLDAALFDVASRGFDVTLEIPVRVALFEVSPTDYVLVMVLHHIAADGLSFRPLARDLLVAYSARSEKSAPAWTPLPIQYADYALWQREALGSDEDPRSESSRQINFWRRALADLPDQLEKAAIGQAKFQTEADYNTPKGQIGRASCRERVSSPV